MVNLYLFRSTPVNITNLPHFCFLIGTKHQSAPGNCIPKISHNCFLDVDQSEFTKTVSAHQASNVFRKVDWSSDTELLSWLDLQLAPLQTQNLVQCISHYSVNQLKFLRDRYYDNSTIVSVSYDTNTFNMLIDYHVRSHLIKQKLGLIPLSDVDVEVRSTNTNLIDYYTTAFKEQNILDKTMEPVGDYDIPVTSFFKREQFFQHLRNLNVIITDEVVAYYNAWCFAYKNFFKE